MSILPSAVAWVPVGSFRTDLVVRAVAHAEALLRQRRNVPEVFAAQESPARVVSIPPDAIAWVPGGCFRADLVVAQ